MNSTPLRFGLFLVILWFVAAAVTLLPGALRVNGHPVDLIQMLDIGYRIVEGDRPHIDFMTPLGVLAFLPLVGFLEAGFGPGKAFLLSQIAVALILLPGIWWVGLSRLQGGARWSFGAAMVLLPMALVFGSSDPAIVASMYYNRWAWVLTSFVVLLLMLPAREGWRSPVVDGLLLGSAGAALIAIKLTFVMGLAPFALVAILQRRAWGTLLWSLISAAVVLGAITLFMGADIWLAYLRDLLVVSSTGHRAYPGEDITGILASPGTLSGTILMLATVIFWRQVGQDAAGLWLLILAPGFTYITYQNWGNDPKWLFILALLLVSLPPKKPDEQVFGQPAGAMSKILAFAAVLIFAPAIMNIAASPLRHLSQMPEDYVPIFTDPSRGDVQVLRSTAYDLRAEVKLPGVVVPVNADDAEEEASPEEEGPLVFLDETLDDCTMRFGIIGWTHTVTADLAAVPDVVGKRVLVADVYDYLWLFGPFERLPGMATWYYGSEDGIDTADYVLVPLCPLIQKARRSKLEFVAEQGWTLEEVLRTELFILAKRAD